MGFHVIAFGGLTGSSGNRTACYTSLTHSDRREITASSFGYDLSVGWVELAWASMSSPSEVLLEVLEIGLRAILRSLIQIGERSRLPPLVMTFRSVGLNWHGLPCHRLRRSYWKFWKSDCVLYFAHSFEPWSRFPAPADP